jgi:NADH dehydrogenase
VEVAGALAEMKKYILPKDYHEMNYKEIDIYIIQSADRLLKGMSDNASEGAEKFLTDLGVIVKKNVRVNDFDGHIVSMDDGTEIKANKVIWAAGITGNVIKGLPEESHCWGNRLKVNRHCQVEGVEDVFAIGDIAYMEEEAFPKGHPQVAQVAIQMGKWLAKNFSNLEKEETVKGFVYKDLGSMATIGRNRAVVDLPNFKFKGFFAWVVWLLIHLFQIIGVKNKLFIFINWVWNYWTYDQSLRLIIKTDSKEKTPEETNSQ